MADLAIRLDERRRPEQAADLERRGRAAFLEGAEAQSRDAEGGPLAEDELERVTKRYPEARGPPRVSRERTARPHQIAVVPRRQAPSWKPMRHLLWLGAVWSVVVLGLFLFWPVELPVVPCGVSDPTCQSRLAAANRDLWWTQTLPHLAVFASGYVVLGLLTVRQLWRSRRSG